MQSSDQIPERQIPDRRRKLYYCGMALVLLGLIFFFSSFFMAPAATSAGVHPSSPDFWEKSQAQAERFNRDTRATMVRALAGMGLIAIGGVLMQIGARGSAGSGMVLNPERARRDLEPWSRMGGGMVKDALSEAGIATENQPAIKVRCRACSGLNDETAKFCSTCGTAM